MKKYLTPLFVMLSLHFSAQEKPLEKKPVEDDKLEFHRFQFGLSFSPEAAFRTLVNNNGSSTSNMIIQSRNSYEIPKAGFTLGFSHIYNSSRNFGFEIGIHYSNKGFQTKEIQLYDAFGEPADPQSVIIAYNNNYLDIPLKVRISAGKRKLRFTSGIGVTTNVFLSERQVFYSLSSSSDKKTKEDTGFDYRRINFSPTVSFGIDCRLSSRMNLKVEPIFRYMILKITDDPISGYLWNAGLNISFYHAL